MTEATTPPAQSDSDNGDATATPSAGDPAGSETSSDSTSTPPSGDDPLGAAGKAALDKERKARAEAEKQLRELLEWKKEQERAGMDEAERLRAETEEAKQRAAEAEQRMRDAILAGAFQREAITAGVNPELADLAMSAIQHELDVDADGNVIGLTSALETLKANRPSLFTPSTPPAPKPPGGTNGGEGQATPPAPNLSAEEVAMAKSFGMSPERWAAMKQTRPDLTKLNKE